MCHANLLCYHINAFCRPRLKAQCVCVAAACRAKIFREEFVATARVVAQTALHIVEVSVNLRVACQVVPVEVCLPHSVGSFTPVFLVVVRERERSASAHLYSKRTPAVLLVRISSRKSSWSPNVCGCVSSSTMSSTVVVKRPR